MDTSGKAPPPVDAGGPRRQPQVIDVKAEPAPPGAARPAESKPAASASETTASAPAKPAPAAQATVRPSAIPPRPAPAATPEPTPAPVAAPVAKVAKAKPHYAYAILLGALTALAGSAALHMIYDPQQQLASLSAKVATLQAKQQQLAGLGTKVTTLQTQLGKVADDSARSRLSAESDHARVTALSAEMTRLSGSKNEIALTRNPVAGVVASSTTPSPAPAGADAALTASTLVVPGSAAAPGVPSPAPTSPQTASTAATAIAPGSATAPAAQSAASIAALAAVTASLSKLQGKVATLDQSMPKVDAALAAHESAIKANQAQIVKAMATPNGAAIAVVSQSIIAALQQGRAFPTELKALQSLHVDPALLAPLAKVADKGPSSTADLARSFAPELAAITKGETPATPAPKGVMGWIGAKAATLVQVRDTRLPQGDEPGAAAARVEAALRRGDAAGALKDWNAMPESAKKLSAAWVAPLQERADAEAAVQKLNEEALAAMTSQTADP